MNLILDIQGFKDENNKFIPKELAAYDGDKINHHVFKQPFSMDLLSPEAYNQALWLMKYHHCICWKSGHTPVHHFSTIIKTLTDDFEFVYVKGREKADYIKKYCNKTIIEIDEQPILVKTAPKCFYHSNSPAMCALSNVFFLYDTFFMNK